MAEAWAIKDWTETFETWETRRLRKPLAYLRFKVAYQSARYKILMATTGGAAAWGVYVSLALVAGKTHPRGMFAREGVEMTTRLMSVESCAPIDETAKAIKILSDPEIGWLIRAEIPTDGRNTWDFALDKSAANVADEDQKPTNDTPKPQKYPPKTYKRQPKTADLAHTTPHNHTLPNPTLLNSNSSKWRAAESDGVAAAADGLTPSEGERQRQRDLAAYIAKRPDWLPEVKPWISRRAANAMAKWDGLTAEWWASTIREARDGRRTLDNPAGYVIAQFQQATSQKAGGAA